MNRPQNEFERMKQDIERAKKSILPVVALILVAIGVYTLFYTVEPDEEAVVIRLGRYIKTEDPGLQFKMPFGVDRVIKFRYKIVLQEEFGFRTTDTSSRITRYAKKTYGTESLMLTGDLNVADVEWAVQYKISDPFKYIFQTSEPTQNVRDVSESIMRRVVGDRSVTDVLTVGKVEIESEAKRLMQDVLNKYDMGILIVSVKLQDVNPPSVVKQSFNEVNEAKQEQEKAINEAEGAYNKVIPEARGKAEKLVSEAEGYAEAVVNRAIGDVKLFEEILVEYKRAPQVTKKRIYLDTMQEIFKELNNTVIIDSRVKGVLPVYSGKDLKL
ncbi:MAG: FtsH protease activity modulator HflK [Bdellovibrionota bacterium]|nr:FtsH protease activity modulator HflK [Bdellovibrionota bacterium]